MTVEALTTTLLFLLNLCALRDLCVNRFFFLYFLLFYFNNIFGSERISIFPRSSVSV